MGFKCGIVGLPNVGKSTLFNALTRTAAAQAANYPFCTIEPNTGEVAVPDPRLYEIAKIAGSKEIIPTRIAFVDIAGLVRGASKGEGLGNQFLANIREVDAIVHVLRCFEDDDITHVEGRIDPVADAETVETELMLADLDSLELEHQLRGRKISIAPGILFSASGKYRHCIRLNYARIPGPDRPQRSRERSPSGQKPVRRHRAADGDAGGRNVHAPSRSRSDRAAQPDDTDDLPTRDQARYSGFAARARRTWSHSVY